ncbi:Dihydrolipoamide acetyltransferase component of pyruvate dehydrogenase complex [Hyphomicrobiales bacterium]|nr:Dihydrolipoamide acetyltransferase component of pyruvate dehydrogenase complex [Hyphomicrobiales bacterium]CAH1692108.1 Dihydrolipoamide acetyltransferase component of pyruvate dehydrogenase complex [Hyphomicrobiales bacterium]
MSELVMPKLGLTMTEGLLSEWRLSPGESYVPGQVLYSIETEKVATEIEAETSGTLEQILVTAGETVPVGTPVARIITPGEAAPPRTQADVAKGQPDLERPKGPSLDSEVVEGTHRNEPLTKADVLRVIATPLARRIAAAKGIDLQLIQGSGARGRIKAADVEAISHEPAPQPDRRHDTPRHAATREILPDATRLATARRVTAAKRDIPHFYLTLEAEVSALSDLRERLNAEAGRSRISVTHMLVKALGLALAEMPQVNRIWSNDKIVAFTTESIGVVVETPDGLRIPVLRDVGDAPLDRIASLTSGVADRARNGRLGVADVGDSVISISNVGMHGATSLTAIINPPNALILGVGAERQLFRPNANGQPHLCRELSLTLSCDHRVIDGADAARFLSHLVGVIEQPIRLLRPPRRPQ